VITPVLKTIFDRPRPQVFEWRAHYPETSAAYPSGHATMSMVTLVTVAFIIHRLSKHGWTGALAGGLATVAILLIGLSRLYLGLHFPSDVLAGYVVGFAWAVLCAITLTARTDPGPRSNEGVRE
jgi:undecaprenyl-diphosphatase